MNPDNIEPSMIGEILFYEHSNCIKREPEDIAFYNEGILENAPTIIENTDPQSNEVKSEITDTDKLPNENLAGEAIDSELPNIELIGEAICDKLPKEELIGEAIYDKLLNEELIGEAICDKLAKEELVGEAVDFDCGLAEVTKVFQENNCISMLAEPNKENEKVNISVIVNSSANKSQNDNDFYIKQTNSDSLLMYKCNMCPNPHFFKRNYLENTDKPGHPPAPKKQRTLRYKCEVPGCEYKTDCRGKLINHAAVHSEKIYKCDVCAFTTKSEKYLEDHKNSIHNPNSQRFFCKQCSYNGVSQVRLRQHEMLHLDPDLRETYKCSFLGCPFEANSKKSMSRHALVHKDPSEIKYLKCPKCLYTSAIKRYFDEHVRNHNKRMMEKMYCFNCSFATVSRPSLIKHMLTHRKVEDHEMFNCSQCSYTSKRKTNLKQHMIKHTDVEMLKCFHCAFETKRKHTLRNHMDIHKKS